MTMHRRLLLAGLLAGLTIAGVLEGWLTWPRTAITPEHAAMVQPGMTLEEVEAVLGPARDATCPMDDRIIFGVRNNPEKWISTECCIAVYFVDTRAFEVISHSQRDDTMLGTGNNSPQAAPVATLLYTSHPIRAATLSTCPGQT